jgi:F-type H+-transporting ATPase subunit c
MKTKLVLLMIALLFCAVPMFAQGTAAGTAGGNPWVPVTAGFAMAIASGLVGLGMGRAVGGAVEGMARNPGAA